MVYVVAIPTTRERGTEINICVNSIVGDPTFDKNKMSIFIFGQTNDPTISQIFLDTGLPYSTTEEGYRCLNYLGPDNLQRMIIYLTQKGFKRNELEPFFNFRTYGGARNVLTAFAFLLAKTPSAVISIDDDEQVLPGFFGEHISWLGKTTRRGEVISLVTGPYKNHDSYVGIETLTRLLRHRIEKTKAEEALNSITYVNDHETPKGYIYRIKGARGGNLSRCGPALMIPYISSSEDIPMRGEDEVQADLNQRINKKAINLYTPKAIVIHKKRPGYLLNDIKGEVIGSIVHEVILFIYENINEENILDGLQAYIQREAESQLNRFIENIQKARKNKKYDKYPSEIEYRLEDLTRDTLQILNNTQFFADQVVNHLRTAVFGLRYWGQIVECLVEAKEDIVKYIFSLPYNSSYTVPHRYTPVSQTTASHPRPR
jgi:hypothetical protein